MVNLSTAIEEINKGKICFYEKEEDTTLTTEGEVVIYLGQLMNIYMARDMLEDMRNKRSGLDESTIDIIVDVINNGTYAEIFKRDEEE